MNEIFKMIKSHFGTIFGFSRSFRLMTQSKGFGLIEVMIAVGLTSIVMLVLMQAASSTSNMIRMTNFGRDGDMLNRVINMTFRNPAQCDLVFGVTSAAGPLPNVTLATLTAGIDVTARLPINRITVGGAIVPAPPGQVGMLRVQGLRLENPRLIATNNAYLVDMVVQIDLGGQPVLGSPVAEVRNLLKVFTNGANTLTECRTGSESNDLSNSATFDCPNNNDPGAGVDPLPCVPPGPNPWIVPDNVTEIKVELWGAGGGGGGGFANTSATAPWNIHRNVTYGEGGGSGGYLSANLPVTPGQTLFITIGSGGGGGNGASSAAIAPTNQGRPGDPSCISTAVGCGAPIARAPGGQGGVNPGTGVVTNSDGGMAGGWEYDGFGNKVVDLDPTSLFIPLPGPNAITINGQWGAPISKTGGGPGGSAPKGGLGGQIGPGTIHSVPAGPAPPATSVGYRGERGTFPGGGGGPSNHSGQPGGSGANGRVVIYW